VSRVPQNLPPSTKEELVAVKGDMVGNGALKKLATAKHVQQTFTKTKTKVSAHDVLTKQPPSRSPMNASVQVGYLGMEAAASTALHKM
jgi:hypothetical protein